MTAYELQLKKNIKIIAIFLVIFLLDIIVYFNIIANYNTLGKILLYIKNIIIIAFFIIYIFINFKYIKYIKENKNAKNILISIFLPIIVCAIIFLLIIKIYDFIFNSTIFNVMIYDQTDLSLNDSNEYLIVTNSKQLTYMSDGGSHYNIYYKIDLSENLIIKYQDHYIGFTGYEYLGKVLYKKDLSSEETLQLKNLLDTIFSNIETDLLDSVKYDEYDENDNSLENIILSFSSTPPYYFSSLDYSNIEVYNEDLIEEFESIVEE